MRVFYLVAAFLMLSTAYAGTVTLTGTCSQNAGSNLLNFTLSNSGNEAGTNLTLLFQVIGVNYPIQHFNISQIAPSGSASVSVPLGTISQESGSLPGYFLVQFHQDASIYNATFPCIVNLGNSSSSQLSLSTNITQPASGQTVINASVSNEGNTTVNVNLALILPPIFNYNRNQTHLVAVVPGSSNSSTFQLTYPAANGNFSGAVAAYYLSGGQYHSSISSMVLSTDQTAGNGSSPFSYNFAELAIGAVVLILIVLIGRAVYIRRSGRPQGPV